MTMMRRYRKKSSNEGIAAIVFLAIGLVLLALQWIANNPEILIILSVIALIWMFDFIRKKEKAKIKHEEYLGKLNSVAISDHRESYIIKKEDYKRGNKKESYYRKKHVLTLLNLYKNKCAKCGSTSNGFDLDHFIISKNEGGNFALLHKDEYLINNAIPLCQTCNRSKGDRSYKEFFNQDEILHLFSKNKEMTLIINNE